MVRVKRFIQAWLDRSVDGILVKEWCVASEANIQRAKCIVCPPTTTEPLGVTFNIAQGFSAVRRHAQFLL